MFLTKKKLEEYLLKAYERGYKDAFVHPDTVDDTKIVDSKRNPLLSVCLYDYHELWNKLLSRFDKRRAIQEVVYKRVSNLNDIPQEMAKEVVRGELKDLNY